MMNHTTTLNGWTNGRTTHDGYVLITGATSGIGRELARLFAEDRCHLIIVGHESERLARTRAWLLHMGAPDVVPVLADLMQPDGPAIVARRTKHLEVGTLVNNAGAGEYGRFTETDLHRELAIIQMNVAAVVHLTKLFLPAMLARRKGRILNVASISSYQPTPRLAVYAATKAFVLSFSDGLRHEMKDTGVVVSTLIPGPTATNFFREAGMVHTVAANRDPAAPRDVAKAGYEALMKDEAHALGPGVRGQVVMSSALPNQQVAAMANAQMEPMRR